MDEKRGNTGNSFDSLREQCRQLGLFKRSKAAVFGEVIVVAVLWALAIVLRESNPVLAMLLAIVAAITLVWWIHDSGHDAFFESRAVSHKFIETLGLIFLGMPQIEYHYEVHRLHHAHTNIIGRDGALATGPVRWHYKQLRSLEDQFNKWQPLIWFAVALPLVWPLITARCIQTLWARKKWLRLSLIAVRWAVVLWIFRQDLSFVFVPPLVGGFVMGFVSSLNHFHMPMDDKRADVFPNSVFITTQNLRQRGFFATWITGGLNFHIEHHLFPTMPSKNLRYAAPLVERFAREHGLSYNICDSTQAIGKLYDQLRHPTTENPIPKKAATTNSDMDISLEAFLAGKAGL